MKRHECEKKHKRVAMQFWNHACGPGSEDLQSNTYPKFTKTPITHQFLIESGGQCYLCYHRGCHQQMTSYIQLELVSSISISVRALPYVGIPVLDSLILPSEQESAAHLSGVSFIMTALLLVLESSNSTSVFPLTIIRPHLVRYASKMPIFPMINPPVGKPGPGMQ